MRSKMSLVLYHESVSGNRVALAFSLSSRKSICESSHIFLWRKPTFPAFVGVKASSIMHSMVRLSYLNYVVTKGAPLPYDSYETQNFLINVCGPMEARIYVLGVLG